MTLPSELTDSELVAEFNNGNTAAFDEIMERHAERLYRTAYSLLDSHHDAEEVVQETFLRAYRALSGFRGDSSLSTWLQRIVTNLSRNKFQWNRRRGSEVNRSISGMLRDADTGGYEDIPLPDDRLTPDRGINNREIGESIVWAINQLPERLRPVVSLRYLQNYSYDEIAKTLDCNIGSVKSRLSRSRELLVELLHKRGIV
ncbi:MAG: sigma-70 family RNA polymerase sigma factor [Victivallaceae bacterium]|nr:sigma-70 family RNA polymerase sigma factor [Victivallaceae bacterium]